MSFRSLSAHYAPTQASRSSVAWTNSTSIASRPNRSSAAETQRIANAIQREQHGKDLAIIVVVPRGSLNDVERRCRPSSLKFWKGQSKSLILFATPERLQYSLLDVQFSPKRHRLSIIVSDQIRELPEPFDVHTDITTLKILRSSSPLKQDNHKDSDDDDDDDDDDELLLDGASTFHNTRLDDWLAQHRNRHLHLGEGVRIRVDNLDGFLSMASGSTSSLAASSSATLVLSEEQRAAVREHLQNMEGLSTKGSWWEQWKGPVAGVLGAVAGTAQLAASVSASAKGLYLAVAIPSAAIEAGLVAAGMGAAASGPVAPAVAIGVAVGLAVYFIPWAALFRYLREKVLPSLIAVAKKARDAIVGFFERLMSWLKSLLATTPGEKDEKAEEAHSRFPMRFPA